MLTQKYIDGLMKSSDFVWKTLIEPCGLISRETWDEYTERLVRIIQEDNHEKEKMIWPDSKCHCGCNHDWFEVPHLTAEGNNEGAVE